MPPPIRIPASPLITKRPPVIFAPASLPAPSRIVILPLRWPNPAQGPALLSQVILFPSLPAPKYDPTSPWWV